MTREARPELEQFASTLRSIMAARNVSVTELAEQLDVSRSAVSHWRVGTSAPTVPNVVKIAQLLDVPAETLFQALSGKEPEPPAEVPEWAKSAGNLSAETVAAIRMLIRADQDRRRE